MPGEKDGSIVERMGVCRSSSGEIGIGIGMAATVAMADRRMREEEDGAEAGERECAKSGRIWSRVKGERRRETPSKRMHVAGRRSELL